MFLSPSKQYLPYAKVSSYYKYFNKQWYQNECCLGVLNCGKNVYAAELSTMLNINMKNKCSFHFQLIIKRSSKLNVKGKPVMVILF